MAQRILSSDSANGFDVQHDDIFIELKPGRPAYIHLQVGDLLQEGDAFHREQLGQTSQTLQTWEVIDITAGSVVGRDIATNEETSWSRDEIVTGLTVGTYSTNLTDFEWISVYQVGDWENFDPEAVGEGLAYAGKPYVSVVAYGDNGLKYGRRYRFVDQDSQELELWERDQTFGKFNEETATQLNDRIRAALEAEGYTVGEHASS